MLNLISSHLGRGRSIAIAIDVSRKVLDHIFLLLDMVAKVTMGVVPVTIDKKSVVGLRMGMLDLQIVLKHLLVLVGS